jgi:acyl carrier protein
MSDIKSRVGLCFANVFPGIKPDQLSTASSSSLPGWDSIAQVRLMSSIEEEFGVQLEIEDFEELVSYDLIVAHLEKLTANA